MKSVFPKILALLLILWGMMSLIAADYHQSGGQHVSITTTTFPDNQAAVNTSIFTKYPNDKYYSVEAYSMLHETTRDAVSKSEVSIEELVAKVSGRVEEIRQLNFLEEVPIETISREQYNQVMKVYYASRSEDDYKLYDFLFNVMYLLPEGVSSADFYVDYYGEGTLAYYSIGDGTITYIENESAKKSEVDESTLAHELTHAVTAQNFPSAYYSSNPVTDGDLAMNSLIEGDAEKVADLYSRSFKAQSLLLPSFPSLVFSTELPKEEINLDGLYLLSYFPYLEGVNFVTSLLKKDDWSLINEAYLNLPVSTEQVIHPEKYPIEGPIPVTVPGRVSDEWQILGEDRLGEVGLFAMFFNQGMANLARKSGGYSCSSPLSGGWGGDKLVIYGSTDNKLAYIWVVEMDTTRDANEFMAGYEKLLGRIEAQPDGGLWQVGKDYLKVQQSGNQVMIVRAPTPEDVAQLWPGPSITVVSPNGGDNWQIGTTQEITWTSDDVDGKVRIEISQDGGKTWKPIIPSTPNDGSQPWTVKGKISSNTRIRVVSVTDKAVLDESDTSLSICLPTITLISPNGGDNWEIGATQNITWTSDGLSGKVKIELSVDGGKTWKAIVLSTPNDGSQTWKVTGKATTEAQIRVISATNKAVLDASDANFTIKGP